jgi:hypothetical protein
MAPVPGRTLRCPARRCSPLQPTMVNAPAISHKVTLSEFLRAWIARAKTAATAASWSRRRRSRVLTPGGADIISVTCTAAFGVPIVAGLSRDDFTQITVQRVSIPVAAAKKVVAMLASVERRNRTQREPDDGAEGPGQSPGLSNGASASGPVMARLRHADRR